MKYPEKGRRCAACGGFQSHRRGGLSAYGYWIDALKRKGWKFKDSASNYLHVSCATSIRKAGL